MHIVLHRKLIEQATALEATLFSLHRDCDEGKERHQLGYAWMSLHQAKSALEGNMPDDSQVAERISGLVRENARLTAELENLQLRVDSAPQS